MKIEVYGLAVMLKVAFLLTPCFAGDSGKGINLNWTHKIGQPGSEVLFSFRRVQVVRGFLKFELTAHNLHKNDYQCLRITATEDSVPMDDDRGGQYRGATVESKEGLDNPLALNQIRVFTISIPAPREGVTLVNLHLGLFSRRGSDRGKCPNPTGNWGYNFHQLNWDVSWIGSRS